MKQPTFKQIAETALKMLVSFAAMITILTLISMLLFSCYPLQKLTHTPVDFGKPTYIYDLQKVNISDGMFYAGHTVTLKENVEYKDSALYLYTKYYNQFYHFWDGDMFCYHSTGWVDFQNINKQAYGTWEAEITLPEQADTWPAFWSIHERHYAPETAVTYKIDTVKYDTCTIPIKNLSAQSKISLNWIVRNDNEFLGYVCAFTDSSITVGRFINRTLTGYVTISPDHITPEIDVMEVLKNGKIKHTVHHGYDRVEYSLYHDGKYICRPKSGHKYKFAVKITPEGYTFYIDRIKTYELINPNSTCDSPLTWILNNAIQPGINREINSTMIVHSLKYYENE